MLWSVEVVHAMECDECDAISWLVTQAHAYLYVELLRRVEEREREAV